VPNGKHHKKARTSTGRRWGGRLALAGTVAAGTAIAVISLDGGAPATTAASNQAAVTAPSTQAAVTAPLPSPSTTTTVVPDPTTTTTSPQRGPWFLPDGTVLPVLLVYNGPTTTLAGALPSRAALARLMVLAQAYAQTPGAQIINHVVIDPSVPLSVGLRVIEMDAGRFPEGSADITAQYAPELTRVVAAMKTMANVTLLVVGHADQTGPALANVQLSEARAESVITYLSSQGISAARMSARGVGDDDPLTTQSNEAGLALNRRTEFVFYGLFATLGR
jgi:outer membrane protein OmpA-like peptidoglycan-associated protein